MSLFQVRLRSPTQLKVVATLIWPKKCHPLRRAVSPALRGAVGRAPPRTVSLDTQTFPLHVPVPIKKRRTRRLNRQNQSASNSPHLVSHLLRSTRSPLGPS